MKAVVTIITIFSISFLTDMPTDKFPRAVISNGILTAKILLPDEKTGYYQGTRFDWSGNIESLKFSGHEYFGKWFAVYDPKIHDAIMGPVDDFLPIDYDQAAPGENFLKIGIGVITRPDEKPWTFARTYPVADYGRWKVKTEPDRIIFGHRIKGKKYSYEYEKIVELVSGKPEMVLVHRLRNNGNTTLETQCYNHNFFVIDNQPVGPDYSAEFPFRIAGKFRDNPELVEIMDNMFTLRRELVTPETIYSAGLQGPGDSGYDITVENRKSGAGVRITCDKPLLKMVFWANPFTFCPEPYITVKADPGETFEWTIRYFFYRM